MCNNLPNRVERNAASAPYFAYAWCVSANSSPRCPVCRRSCKTYRMLLWHQNGKGNCETYPLVFLHAHLNAKILYFEPLNGLKLQRMLSVSRSISKLCCSSQSFFGTLGFNHFMCAALQLQPWLFVQRSSMFVPYFAML